ncbi:MAG: agmatinase [Rhodospirillales bacterium]|jgi:agmatinase|nr:agmatinase [Rhodospirillales bacterium]
MADSDIGSGSEDWGTDHAFTRDSVYGLKMENTFSGALSYLRMKYSKDLEGIDIAVTGIPFDLALTNRPGTRFGPRGIRQSSCDLAFWANYPWDFDPLKRLACIDYGDCDIDFAHPQNIPNSIEAHITGILDKGASSLSMGGDHFISLPILRAYAKKFGPMAIVHFDAHSDTWPDEEGCINHGSMFYHAVKEGIIDVEHSVQVGIRTNNSNRMGLKWLDNEYVHENGHAKTAAEIKRIVGDAKAYLTFDIDCLDPAFAPGTGTPVCCGLSTYQARKILCALDGIDFKGMDLVEVSPQYDVGDVTSLAGATLMFDYISLMSKDLPEKHKEKA